MSVKRRLSGSDWAEALESVLKKQVDDVPKDWLTSEQVGKKMGIKFGQASKFLNLMIKEGVVEKRKFKIMSRHGTGLVRPTEHYRLIATSSVKGNRLKAFASSKS